MSEEEEYEQYRESLLGSINAINREIPLEEKNQLLIVWKLNTAEKISKFNEWVKSKLKDGKLNATEAEIVRAAVLRVENKRQVENFRLKRRVLAVAS